MNTFSLYRHLPIWMQNLLVAIKGRWLEHQRYGRYYKEAFRELCVSDNWNQEQILAYKEKQLAHILKYAYEFCPYYKQKFDNANVSPDDFKHLNDIQKFPILTKDEVREHWAEMLSTKVKRKDLVQYHTSGSTGKALDFYWTKQSVQYYWAVVWRGRYRLGVKKGDLHLNFTGKLVVPLNQRKPPYWRYNRVLNQYMLNMQHIRKETIEDIAQFINNKHFRFFVGYPSIIYELALLCNQTKQKITAPPEYIFTSAEKVYDYQRTAIQEVFPGSEIVEHYGFSEEACCASQCECGIYHEDFELGHLELHEPYCAENKLNGTLLATGFQNLGMPFIRYEIGDRAVFSERQCECGRHNQVIENIEGRNEDYVITKDGMRFTRLDYLLKDTKSIAEAQIVQRKIGQIIVRVVRKYGFNELEEQMIRKIVHDQFSENLEVEFEYVDFIKRTKAGKFRFIVNELIKK